MTTYDTTSSTVSGSIVSASGGLTPAGSVANTLSEWLALVATSYAGGAPEISVGSRLSVRLATRIRDDLSRVSGAIDLSGDQSGKSRGFSKEQPIQARPVEAIEIESYLQTDLAQQLSATLRRSEAEVVSKLSETLAVNWVHPSLRWEFNGRFINLLPRDQREKTEQQLAGQPLWSLRKTSALRLFVFTEAEAKTPLTPTQRARLSARMRVQSMAAALLRVPFSHQEGDTASFRHFVAQAAQAGPDECISIVVFPHAITKGVFTTQLRRLSSRVVMVESVTGAAWGEQDAQRLGKRGASCLIDDPDLLLSLPEARQLSAGQVLALAEDAPRLELDLSGAGRGEVQNLLWLARSLTERIEKYLSVLGHGEESHVLTDAHTYQLWGEILAALSLHHYALETAMLGGVGDYVAFWRGLLARLLRFINNPALYLVSAGAAATHKIRGTELSSVSAMLSKSSSAWEEYLEVSKKDGGNAPSLLASMKRPDL